jgi:hypothetical protein
VSGAALWPTSQVWQAGAMAVAGADEREILTCSWLAAGPVTGAVDKVA